MRVVAWLRREWLLLLAILVGSGLRVYQLGGQIIADDEWHALHMARDVDFVTIATHFGGADVSIPIALYYKTMLLSFGLSEWIMRAPILLFGLLSLVVFPLLVREVFGPLTSTLFAWLLALSPIHIYFSRYARPYSISLFCAFAGAFAFYLWRTTKNRRWMYFYAACAILGPYFHLSVLAVLLAPLAWSFVSESQRTEIVELILFVGAGLTTLLAPPIFGDFASLADKAGHGALSAVPATDAIGLLFGTGSHLIQAITVGVIALGAYCVLTTQSRFGILMGSSAIGAILMIVISRPTGIEFPIVVARYALFLLPVLLLLLAAGLRMIGGWLTGNRRQVSVLVGLAWTAVMLKSGTLQEISYAPNNFTNYGGFQYYPSLDPQRNPYVQTLSRPVSSFYLDLGRQPASSLRLLEAPWYYEWGFNPYPFFQRVHRQQVAIGFVTSEQGPVGEWPAFDRRFRFRNFVHLQDMNSLCGHGIDRVVIHKDLGAELGRLVDRDFSKELPALIEKYRQFYGPAIFEDATLLVFNTTDRCSR